MGGHEKTIESNVLLSIIVPVFNEQGSIVPFMDSINNVFCSKDYINLEIIFINDGSNDSTLENLLSHQLSDSRIKIIDFSRNFGKEAAISAGLFHAVGDVVVPIDVDLQDPPEIILDMFGKWQEGYEVVLAKRIDRSSDSWIKRTTATLFYRVYNKLSRVKLPENVGDFRLMDRLVVEAIKQLPESRIFMKGIFSWVGYKSTHINYTRAQRVDGDTKFGLVKLWNFALEGITSFSELPLKIWTYIGFVISLISISYALVIAVRVSVYGVDVSGYASTIVIILFLGGIQLIGIGVLGEYLGRTYIESKRRPSYLIRKIYK